MANLTAPISRSFRTVKLLTRPESDAADHGHNL